MIKFSQLNHEYTSIDSDHPIDWIGVTTLISYFEPGFDPEKMALKASKNKKSKWYGLTPEEIKLAWKNESKRSLDAGNWFHNKTEGEITSSDTFNGLSVIKPKVIAGDKFAPDQVLENNTIYPEHLAYLKVEGICGQTDRVDVTNHKVNIEDHKTSKIIKTEGFRSWEGLTQRMSAPLEHLDDCNLVHYSLQISMYLYMILRHNPQFLPGSLTLNHVLFELESEDQYGYPIYRKDSNGDYIVKDINHYKIPYLKSEVISILNHLKENREQVKEYILKRRH
jgi:hypothetical protein